MKNPLKGVNHVSVPATSIFFAGVGVTFIVKALQTVTVKKTYNG